MKINAIAIVSALSATAASAQPVQWPVEDGGNGHWYEFVSFDSDYRHWTQAKPLAESRGGYLATLVAAAEQQFVNSQFTSRVADNGFPAFVGGYQDRSDVGYVEPRGGWKWVTGEPWTFTFWRPGQPDNMQGVQDFLAVAPEGVGLPWDDVQFFSNCMIVEYSADCNADGLVDKGQILSGQLLDLNGNGIPEGPAITVQPADQTVGGESSVTFIVDVTQPPACAAPVTYQWQRRNPAVADPQAPGAWIDLSDGGGFLNTRSPALAIARPTPALATGFRCRIGGGCACEPSIGGFIYSNTVNFSVACPADFNADGGIDFGDVEAFFERWENGC
ncbi:MAG: hypothetical protein RL689_2166 [Planctomycetota bacterium]